LFTGTFGCSFFYGNIRTVGDESERWAILIPKNQHCRFLYGCKSE
jgi:hypothetical protein